MKKNQRNKEKLCKKIIFQIEFLGRSESGRFIVDEKKKIKISHEGVIKKKKRCNTLIHQQ